MSKRMALTAAEYEKAASDFLQTLPLVARHAGHAAVRRRAKIPGRGHGAIIVYQSLPLAVY